jgi:hypothetical protein
VLAKELETAKQRMVVMLRDTFKLMGDEVDSALR